MTGNHTLTVLTADRGIRGTFDETPEIAPAKDDEGVGHLGSGLFLSSLLIENSNLTLNLIQALMSDTEGDRDVDITDFSSIVQNLVRQRKGCQTIGH